MTKIVRILIALLFIGAGSVSADKFYRDDPHWKDPDVVKAPAPAERDLSKMFDFAKHTFSNPGDPKDKRALNINTLGEVPDSSWFLNRIGLKKMTPAEVAQGPNRGKGPDTNRPWKVISAKTSGATPGFVIKDSRNDVYFVKLDSPNYPELMSSAEIISTKFFWAAGYNTPENYLAYIRPGNLKVDGESKGPGKKQLTQSDLAILLSDIPRRNDGTIRVIASRALKGEPIGPFLFYGTRPDDPNDVIPHEHRRELRGYYVFCSWLNHNDSDAVNTLDMYLEDEKVVQHNLIDFGTTLGSAALGPHSRRAGNEHYLDWKPMLLAAVSLGIWDRDWRDTKYPEFPSVGRFESKDFEPEEWKPDYPNPAFSRMLNEDAFWAARIISRFDDAIIQAVVESAQMSDPAAETYMIQTLKERRDKIVRHYFGLLNPVTEFTVADSAVKFQNPALQANLGTIDFYEYQWFALNNETGKVHSLTGRDRTATPSIPVLRNDSPYLMVRIWTRGSVKNWGKAVDVYLRKGSEIVGIEREN